MKLKILIVTLGLIAVSQLPFAYRRYRLSHLQSAIEQLASQRVSSVPSEYFDYQGVIHVHSFLGGHSTGTFAELIAAAKANGLDFVIMTEHPQADFDTSAMTLTGVHAGILFLNGNEIASTNGDRLLLMPGLTDAEPASRQSTHEIVEKQQTSGGLSFVAYPAESHDWQESAVNGVEIYNLFTNARHSNPLMMFFDGLWSYSSYPDLMFANFFSRPAENLQRWDEAMSATNHPLVATAGNDAHSNVGLSVNDASGKQWLGIKLDPYERSFRIVRTHILIKKDQALSRESLLRALSAGHCYVSFDLFGDPRGFSFTADEPESRVMGDEVSLHNGSSTIQNEILKASAPLVSRFVLFRNGAVIDQKSGTTVQFSVNSSGRYRLEVYLDSLPSPARGKPWIFSNPIYVK